MAKEDTVIDKSTLDEMIRQGIADYEAGKVYRKSEKESSEAFRYRCKK